MPRISSDQTQERHAFLLDLFRQQPDLERQEALSSFKEKFGATISPKILEQLRAQAAMSGDSDSRSEEAAPSPQLTEDAASRLKAAAAPDAGLSAQPAPKAKAPKGARQRNVFVDASQEQLQFLERIVQQLQEAGANNLRIDHSTDRWMVLVVDAK